MKKTFNTCSHTTITACESYEWNGQTYTESGTYTQSISSINEYENFFTKHSALGWNDEDDIRVQDVEWLADENMKDDKLTYLTVYVL